MLPPQLPPKHSPPIDAADGLKQPPLDSSGRWKLSLGRSAVSPGQAFLPARDDIKLAVRHLEIGGTGKVRETQVKMLLELAFGDDAAPEKVAKVRERCAVTDGRVEVESVESAVDEIFMDTRSSEQVEAKEGGNEEASDASQSSSSVSSRLPRRSSSRAPVKSKRGSGTKFDCLAQYAEAFVRFDHNKDGLVTPEDLQHTIDRSSLVKISLGDCQEAIARVDAQQVGGVTLLELRFLMEQIDHLLAGAEDEHL